MGIVDGEDVAGGRRSRGQTPDRLDTTAKSGGGGSNPHSRRGSHLLVAAGIGIEQRRKLSQQNAEAHGKVFQQGNQVYIEDKDGNVTRLEVVEVAEKMGLLRKAVPTLPVFFAIIFCLLNTILPGTGNGVEIG
ncbi:Protein stum [Folsomia candida]|uniref:Protein stum n=1 Tax=Folsomia candida TaxID=158441 RepID=A0A226DC33_FOLCA|nr:Protein stum [Folsomia candida]